MIVNRDRFPEVRFLPDSDIKVVGSSGSVPLVLIGWTDGFEADQPMPVLALSWTSDPITEELRPIMLYELMGQHDELLLPGLADVKAS